ncbi:MAG: transcriptional repressor NrdR [Planctomycetes bacterium]|nr:transcriptional repressor NrdR [Planctomycetota bacterium]
MRCPYCKTDSDKVVDTRSVDESWATRRRRECLKCGRRFTTYERVEESPLKVVKKDGSRVPFDRTKIRLGIERACGNLPIPAETIDGAVASIENEVFSKYEREVPSVLIGELVMRELAGINKVAYVRFASVYREFQEVGEFYNVLEEINDSSGSAPRPQGATGPAPGGD